MKQPDIKIKYLNNKIPTYLVNYNQFKKFSVYFFVNVGSAFEENKIKGISHFLEHMVFKNTKKIPNAIALASYLEKYGITFNAYTNKVKTCYYFKSPSTIKNLEKICLVAKEMLFHMKIKDKDLEIERNIIRQEHNSGKDNIDDIFYTLMERHYFNNHPLQDNVDGDIKTINNITRNDIINFYETYYQPKNIGIGIIGNVPKSYFKIINSAFGQLPKNYNIFNKLISQTQTPIKHSITNRQMTLKSMKTKKQKSNTLHLGKEKENSETKIILKQLKNHTKSFGTVNPYIIRNEKTPIKYYHIDKSHQSIIAFIFGSKSITHSDYYMTNVISEIIGGNGRYSNKFFDLIREKYGLSYHIKSGHIQYIEGGFMYIYVKVNHKTVLQTINVISKELKSYTKELVNAKELLDFKKNILQRSDTLLENYDNLEFFYLDDMIYKFKEFNLKTYLDRIKNLKLIELNECSRQLLQKDNYQVIVLKPKK